MNIEEKQSHISMCDMAMVCDLCDRDSWEHGTDEFEDDFHDKSCVLYRDREAHKHLLNYDFIDLPKNERDKIIEEAIKKYKPVPK